MNRFDIINIIDDKRHIWNTETGNFSYAQTLIRASIIIKRLPLEHRTNFLTFVFKINVCQFLWNVKTNLVAGIKPKHKISYRTMFALKNILWQKDRCYFLRNWRRRSVGLLRVICHYWWWTSYGRKNVLRTFGEHENLCFGTIKLPVKHNADGIVLDETHEFSDDGYIPDWEWMDM